MVMRMILVSALCVSLAGLTGCISVATPAMGVLLTDVTWDGETEGDLGSKEGRACARSILGLVADGDASIEAAAANGGIDEVTRVDHYTSSILGILGEYCTIVGGN